MAGALGDFEQLILLAVVRLGEEAYGVAIRRAIEEGTVNLMESESARGPGSVHFAQAAVTESQSLKARARSHR